MLDRTMITRFESGKNTMLEVDPRTAPSGEKGAEREGAKPKWAEVC